MLILIPLLIVAFSKLLNIINFRTQNHILRLILDNELLTELAVNAKGVFL